MRRRQKKRKRKILKTPDGTRVDRPRTGVAPQNSGNAGVHADQRPSWRQKRKQTKQELKRGENDY